MERRVLLAALAVAIVLVPVVAVAQANFDLRYDPQSVTTVTGTVVANIDYHPGNPMLGPQAVVIESGGRRHFTVFLGPGSHLSQLGLNLRTGDVITVTASQRNIMGRDYLVASRVMFGSRTFDLRTSAGVPLWSTLYVIPPIGAGPRMLSIPFNSDRIIRESGRIVGTEMIMTAESSVPYLVAILRPNDAFRRDVRVLLGPAVILDEHNIDLDRGAYITVNGSSVDINGSNYLIATSLSQGTTFLNLRTMTGVPLFSVSGSTVLFQPPSNNF